MHLWWWRKTNRVNVIAGYWPIYTHTFSLCGVCNSSVKSGEMCVIKIIYTCGLRHNIYTHRSIGTSHTIPSSDSCILDSNYSSEIAVRVISRKKAKVTERETRRWKKKENWRNLNRNALASKEKMHHYYCYYPSEKYVNKLRIHFWIERAFMFMYIYFIGFQNLWHFFRHFSLQFLSGWNSLIHRLMIENQN